MIPFFGALAVFVFVSAAILLVARMRGSPVEARLTRLSNPGRTMDIDSPFSDRVVIPVLGSFAQIFIGILPHSFVARTHRQLRAAGSPLSTQSFFAVVLLTGVLVPGGLFLLMLSAGFGGILSFFLAGFIGLFGFLGPIYWLRAVVNRRKTAIWRRLPDAFDLITVSVEAGLGLDSALRQVAEKLRGPLAEEIGQMLREVGLGRPRREALDDMAQRVDVKELETFVNAIIQAEQLGTSLGRVLRAQAMTLRVKRRQRAQEIARRAPVKMVFPLVLLIMPTFFIITLGPVVIRLIEYLND